MAITKMRFSGWD